MKLFLDSSALAKRYIMEEGSDDVEKLCADADEIILSVLTLAEVISSFNRILREKKLTPALYKKFKKQLFDDVAETTVVVFDDVLLNRVVTVLEEVSVKTLDAFQLASSMVVGSDTFLTADARQAKGAKELGLSVVLIPLTH